jgi:uncharacterized protein involved in cysteine biosynthesis
MNSMGYKTVGSMILEMISNMIYSTLKSVNDNILDLLENPVIYLENLVSNSLQQIISAIQTKIDSISSEQISVFRNKNIDIPEDELTQIILTHQIFYSILYQIITSIFTLQIFNLSVEEFTNMIQSIMQKELEKFNLDISLEDFNRILNKMITVTFIKDLIKFLIITIPNNILKLIISLFPLIATFTVAYNILEYQAAGFIRLFTGATLVASEMLIKLKNKFKKKKKPSQPDDEKGVELTNMPSNPKESEKKEDVTTDKADEKEGKEDESTDKADEKGDEKEDASTDKADEKDKKGGKRKIFSKHMNKYNKKYYINRIRKTLKSFYKR